jgi:hypothetical protein
MRRVYPTLTILQPKSLLFRRIFEMHNFLALSLTETVYLLDTFFF